MTMGLVLEKRIVLEHQIPDDVVGMMIAGAQGLRNQATIDDAVESRVVEASHASHLLLSSRWVQATM